MVSFDPRVALASLSGEADATWARQASDYAGCAFLGGIALDEPTRAAARELVDRDRNEFLPDDPIAFIDAEIATLSDLSITVGFNVRSATLDPIRAAGAVCREHDAIIEINAHCRQDEMCRAGVGETLLCDTDRLCESVRAASETGATTSVKVRAEIAGVDLPETSRLVQEAGADIVHVDAMDTEPVIEEIVEATEGSPSRRKTELFVIANNGVRDRETVREYLAYGADAVSVGRPSDNPRVLSRVRTATDEWFEAETDGEEVVV